MGCFFDRPKQGEGQKDSFTTAAAGGTSTIVPSSHEGGALSHGTDGGGASGQSIDGGGALRKSTDGGGDPRQGTNGGEAPSENIGGGGPSQTIDEGQEDHQQLGAAYCSVCSVQIDDDKSQRAFIQPCGHAKACVSCAVYIFIKSRLCPICRVRMSSEPKAFPYRSYLRFSDM